MSLFDISYRKTDGSGILTESEEFDSRTAAVRYGRTAFGANFVGVKTVPKPRQSADKPKAQTSREQFELLAWSQPS
jgi:hypothetical protein